MTAASRLPEDLRRAPQPILPPALLIEAPLSVGLVMTDARRQGHADLVEALDRACWDAHTTACDTLRAQLAPVGITALEATYHYARKHAELDELDLDTELAVHSHLYPGQVDAAAHDPLRTTINSIVGDAGNTVQLAYKNHLVQALDSLGLAVTGPVGPFGWELTAAAGAAAQRVRRWCKPSPAGLLQLSPVDLLDDFRHARAGHTRRV